MCKSTEQFQIILATRGILIELNRLGSYLTLRILIYEKEPDLDYCPVAAGGMGPDA